MIQTSTGSVAMRPMTLYPPSVAIPVYAVFTVVAIVLTALRFWTRTVLTRHRLGFDDWLIACGVFIVTICTCIQFYNALHGTGGELVADDEVEARAVTAHKINFVMVVIEKPAFGAIKLSLLFFYQRLFGVRRSFRLANNALIGVIVAWTVVFILVDLFICGKELHLNFAVDQSLAAAHCGDKGLMLLLFAVTGLITDIAVLVVPLFYIRGLQMPREKKWGTVFIFLLGLLSTAACLLRMIFLCVAYPMGRMSWTYKAPPKEKTPMFLLVFNPTFWVMVEMCLGCWAANLPPLGPVLQMTGIGGYVSRAYRKLSSASSSGDHREKPPAQLEEGRLNQEIEWSDVFAPGNPEPSSIQPHDMV